MNQREVSKYARETVGYAQIAMGLGEWTVLMCYEKEVDKHGACGWCDVDHRYKRAWITVVPSEFAGTTDLGHVLRHELLHATHGSFEGYRDAVDLIVDRRERKMLTPHYSLAAEHTVHTLERMLDASGLTYERLVARGKKMTP